MGRFINADSYTSTGQGVLGNNMFAYCNNNPVNHTDPSGASPLLIVAFGGALGGAIVGLIYAQINDMSLRDTVITVIGGAAAGGFGAPVAVLSGGPQFLCLVAASSASGFTAEATGGRFEIGFIVGLGGTLLGTKFPTALLSGEELFWANALATMGISVPAEMVSQGLNQDLDIIQDLLSDDSASSLGGGSSIPLGLRGMGTGAG